MQPIDGGGNTDQRQQEPQNGEILNKSTHSLRQHQTAKHLLLTQSFHLPFFIIKKKKVHCKLSFQIHLVAHVLFLKTLFNIFSAFVMQVNKNPKPSISVKLYNLTVLILNRAKQCFPHINFSLQVPH